ncbi:methylmalonyl-CoA epimerase [candidate division KSB1 bacterium]
MIKKLDHIGIAVKNIDEQIFYYGKLLGLGEPVRETVAEQKVKTAMFKLGEVRIELLEATADDSPIAKFIQKRGQGIHHIALLVDDIDTHLTELKKHGFELINETAQKGTEGQLIAFLHPKSTFGVLTELCQITAGK